MCLLNKSFCAVFANPFPCPFQDGPKHILSVLHLCIVQEWRLYDYITRHFIASLMPNTKYTETKYVIAIGNERFHYTCKTVEDRGYAFQSYVTGVDGVVQMIGLPCIFLQ